MTCMDLASHHTFFKTNLHVRLEKKLLPEKDITLYIIYGIRSDNPNKP